MMYFFYGFELRLEISTLENSAGFNVATVGVSSCDHFFSPWTDFSLIEVHCTFTGN